MMKSLADEVLHLKGMLTSATFVMLLCVIGYLLSHGVALWFR